MDVLSVFTSDLKNACWLSTLILKTRLPETFDRDSVTLLYPSIQLVARFLSELLKKLKERL